MDDLRRHNVSRARASSSRPAGCPHRTNKRLLLRTDGAARGNPGPSSAGVVIERPGGEILARFGRHLGRGTNNEAEYRAVIVALEEARRFGAEEIEIRTDSELLARQLAGRYKVRAANLKPLFKKATSLLRGFRRSDVRHVPREENRDADRMANLALDEGCDVEGPASKG